jgi:hypothetical protein
MADESNRYVPEHRRQAYKGKNLFRGDELRRRREEQQVEIRKQKKDENLAKRRNLAIALPEAAMESDTDEEAVSLDEKVRLLLAGNFADTSLVARGAAQAGAGRLLEQHQRPAPRHNTVPQAPFQGEESADRRGHQRERHPTIC